VQAQNRIYRKKMCPWGQKAVQLLDQHKIEYTDHLFESKEQELRFKKELSVSTTPQVFLDGKHIGGYRELQQYLYAPVQHTENKSSYLSFFVLISISVLLSLMLSLGLKGFLGFSLVLMASCKLMDIKAFVFRFKQYDILAKKLPAYGFVYPFLELGLGLLLLAGLLTSVLAVAAVIIGLLGICGVVKSLFIDKHRFNCASLGGHYPLPLSVLSLTEHLIFVFVGVILLL